MDTNTIIIIIAIFAAQAVPLAMFFNLSKKTDSLKDDITNLKLTTERLNSKIEKLEVTTNANFSIINDRLGILGFSNKNHHYSKEQEL